MLTTTTAHTNPFYSHLSSLMQDKTFREINSTYLSRWSDIEVFILYIKLYDVIERVVPREDTSKVNIINIIHVLMSHTESRRKLISLFQQFKNDEESFTDILKQYITQSSLLLPIR